MAKFEDIIGYLRECYRENGSRGGIWNWFASKVEHRLEIKGTERLAMDEAGVESVYLRQSAAAGAAKAAEVGRKEKDLVYGTIFVVGWIERFEGKPEPVCAPLFTYPAELKSEDHGATLEIDLGRRQIQYPLLEAIGGIEFARELENSIEQTALSESCLGEIRRLFEKAVPDCDTSALLSYPKLIGQSALRQRFTRTKNNESAPLRLASASAVGLIPKSTEMRGVLNELEILAQPGKALSEPVMTLLTNEFHSSDGEEEREGEIPAVLSDAQQKIVNSARKNVLTVAIGPPGTGKTFTIAAVAIERMSERGRRKYDPSRGPVLIASKMDHAVDVVGSKIEKTLGLDGVVVRGGRRGHLKKLKAFISDVLDGLHTSRVPPTLKMRKRRRELDRSKHEIYRLKKRLKARTRRAIRYGELLSRQDPGWLTRLRQKMVKSRARSAPPLPGLAQQLQERIDERIDDVVDYLKESRTYEIASLLAIDCFRDELKNVLAALRARTGARRDQLFRKNSNYGLLGMFPIWLTKLSDVHRILPMRPWDFDLAIIDEATQCDLASALPILQRAKRAMIIGDPKQLRHVSFLPKARQAALADQFGLDENERELFNFRDRSLLDLATDRVDSQEQIAFLDEHFRSQPEIIEFSNREFYSGRLHIMTGHRNPESAPPEPIVRTSVDGVRGANGVNLAEAETLLKTVAETAVAQADWKSGKAQSIGILSPFRNQIEHLSKQFLKLEGAAGILHRHDVMIGTAHTFQGEERDLMFLSLALDDASPHGSYRFLEKPDVFNVMITRARLMNQIFYSFTKETLKPDSLLARFFAYDAELADPKPESQVHDQFANEVAAALRENGAEVLIGAPLAGMKVDLIYKLDGRSRGVDLIGYPGAFMDAFPLERVLIFKRADLPVTPLAYSEWGVRREECIEWLVGRGIDPAAD
ncbi:MAG: hypothetical protein ACI8UO_004206 [Verrucomicrobiales bacterium]|jgi:hypothetical protein